MNVSLFGQRVKLTNIIVLLVLGIILGGSLLCSCNSGVSGYPGLLEGFNTANAAPTDYNIGKGVTGSWENTTGSASGSPWSQGLQANHGGPVPLPEGELFLLANNKFTPECCTGPASSYSNSMGCACLSPEQAGYLNERGGNRTFASEY
jgi:hypothetical protein